MAMEPIDLIPSFLDEHDRIGLESFDARDMPNAKPNPYPWFNPVNITVENGVYYVTIYACHVLDGSPRAQQLSIWLQSLKDTDIVRLSVSALICNIPLEAITQVMAALVNTKAQVYAMLDQIVLGELSYFYLSAKNITPYECGAMFIPAYAQSRREDVSVPDRAILDFYEWIVDEAVEKGRLTAEEAERLHSGSHVVVTADRFV